MEYHKIYIPAPGSPPWPRAAPRLPQRPSGHLRLPAGAHACATYYYCCYSHSATEQATACAAAFLVSASQLYHRVTDRKGAYLFSPAAACPHRHRTGEGNAINPPCLFQRDTTSAAACLSGTPPSLFVVPSRRQDAVERALPTCGAGW